MKQVLQNFKTGVVSVEDVPRPQPRPGWVLVRNKASLISTGTEGGTVKLGKMSLLGKARARPEQVKKVIQALRTEGLLATINAVNRSIEIPVPLGYSCAGVVEASDGDNSDLDPGIRVACGGAGKACHAEFVIVPRNLCVPLPQNVSFGHGAFATVGSVALQAVRTADSRVGDKVVVIGLGLVGLLTVQILKASGCGVLGIDVNPQRVSMTSNKGICPAVPRSSDNLHERILDFTNGYGADAVVIAAAAPTNDPVALAGEIARHRGHIVVVGRTIMEAPRETYLFKELQLNTSYAYGPGTDDRAYEEDGYDYPIGYVRWTENRNMQCFLDLVNDGRIDLTPLISHSFPIEQAPTAYDMITRNDQSPIGVLLKYDPEPTDSPQTVHRVPALVKSRSKSAGQVRVGIIGAGSFATNIMLPILSKRKDLDIRTIASTSGVKAAALAKKYGIPRCTSEGHEVTDADDVDSVFILTRHGTHAPFAEKALLQGKHVFVEKPLALTKASLNAVVQAQLKTGKVLMVGFNRRFSPLAQKLSVFFKGRCQPMIIEFSANVGYRPPEHWLHDHFDGGGVVLGEACHQIDFCRWLVDSSIVNVDAECIEGRNPGVIPEDNVGISLRFEDGSLARILYFSNGSVGLGRERCVAHSESKSAVWEDFRRLKLSKGVHFPKAFRRWMFISKGYKEQLDAFLRLVTQRHSMRIPWLDGQLDASLAAIEAAGKLLRKHKERYF